MPLRRTRASTIGHFPATSLRFGAPFLGLVFEHEYEDAPMPVSDPVLHSIVCARADSLLASITESQAITLRVRRVIAHAIHEGTEPTALGVARILHMSRRTLSRRLDQEGTSFTEELDKTRRELGLSFVRQSKLSLIEVAFQLGLRPRRVVQSRFQALDRHDAARLPHRAGER